MDGHLGLAVYGAEEALLAAEYDTWCAVDDGVPAERIADLKAVEADRRAELAVAVAAYEGSEEQEANKAKVKRIQAALLRDDYARLAAAEKSVDG